MRVKKLVGSAFAVTTLTLALQQVAFAEIVIGVSLPLTGPASGLGIPCRNGFELWPGEIAGEKVRLVILDDASDAAQGTKNARRLVDQDNADLIIGSAATPVGIAIAQVAAEAKVVQLAESPVVMAPGTDKWTFRLVHSTEVMAHAIVDHMKAQGVKTVGFLGYSDAYGESWLKDFTAVAKAAGIELIGTERFARADTSVNAQALKLNMAKPDAVLIVASGSGAAMPHRAMVERGYQGKIYQTHSAASRDLMRVGGQAVEGAYVVTGPAVVADALPDSHPSKQLGMDYIQKYEAKFGPGTRNQFGAHTYDALLVLEKVVPMALQKAKPGTPEFRAALRDALESAGPIVASQGTFNFTPTDHWGFGPDTGVMMQVVNGDWKIEP